MKAHMRVVLLVGAMIPTTLTVSLPASAHEGNCILRARAIWYDTDFITPIFYDGITDCSHQMDALRGRAYIYNQNLDQADSGTRGRCDAPAPCRTIASTGEYCCGFAGQTWFFGYAATLVLPEDHVWASIKPPCKGTADPQTITCNLLGSFTISGGVTAAQSAPVSLIQTTELVVNIG
jgi:hypothetical protein